LKTGKARGLGIPLAGLPGIFRLSGDARRNVLYVRRGYARDYSGPLEWYAIALDANGNFAGEPRKFPLELHPVEIVVGADGAIVCAVPERQAYQTLLDRKARKEKTDGVAPQCEVYRVDPELRKAERIASVADTWEIHWLPWQNGKPTVIGVGERFVCRLDTAKGTIERVCALPKAIPPGEQPAALLGDKIVFLTHADAKPRGGRTMGVHTLELATGKVFFHGLVVDEAGRRPKDLNHFAVLPGGRILAVGTVFGLPTDRHSMTRYRDGEPYRLDCAGFQIEKLPPGTPVAE
jgi:hypothetical protein